MPAESSSAKLLQQSLLDRMPVGFVLFRAVRTGNGQLVDFRYEFVNQAYADLTGKPVSVVTGQLLLQVFPEAIQLGFWSRLVTVLTTGESTRYEEQHLGSGPVRYIDISLTRQDDGVLFIFQDITQTRLLQQKTEELVEQLRQSNEYLQQFAYVASHDLQEPLRKVQTFGNLLEAQYGTILDASGKDLLSRMQRASSRMHSFIQDLLAYSRLSAEADYRQPVDLNLVMQDVLADVELRVQQTQAQIHLSPLPVVEGNRTQLGQLMLNLLSNALKFHRPNQPPRVWISAQFPTENEEQYPLDRRRVQLIVRDEGIGMEPRHTDRIFQMFQRLHGLHKYPGTGVGLALCKKIAENHGGTIQVVSQPGQGSTFIVTLPGVITERSEAQSTHVQSADAQSADARSADARSAEAVKS